MSEPARPPSLATVLTSGAVIAVGLVLVFTIGTNPPQKAGADTPEEVAVDLPEPGSKLPAPGVAAPVDRPHASDMVELRKWSREISGATGIPARIAQSYGLAEMWMRSESPECGLSWATLAGIGKVSSGHGGKDAQIGEDGVLTDPVAGDNGRIGPLLITAKAWKSHRFRAARDGEQPDPQQVDDAAVTVARELCAQDGKLTGNGGWWRAVSAHGGSKRFAQRVHVAQERYSQASEAVTSGEQSGE